VSAALFRFPQFDHGGGDLGVYVHGQFRIYRQRKLFGCCLLRIRKFAGLAAALTSAPWSTMISP
jgi:hypothetical protein